MPRDISRTLCSVSSGEDDAEMQAAALLGLVSVSRERGDFAAARAARDRADQFIQAHLPPEHTMHVNLAFESGLLDPADRSFGEAKVRLQQALTQFQRTKRRQADQIVALSELARCELQSGELDRAASRASEAVALARKFALPGQPSYWLGMALLAQVDVEQALGHAAEARELCRRGALATHADGGSRSPADEKGGCARQIVLLFMS